MIKVEIEFIGMLRKFNNWKPRITLELPDGTTGREALKLFDLEQGVSREMGFLVVNGKKYTKNDTVTLKDGDKAKAFPRSFGG